MNIVHLLASPFYGGPEKQILGSARHLPESYRTSFLTFWERGKSQPFLDEARRQGFEARALSANYPRIFRAASEIAGALKEANADALLCSGYKPDVIGWLAARKLGIPAVSVSHGWTGATWKVRCNEAIDRKVLRWLDAVVCVSHAQGEKVRRAGVADSRIRVISNAIGEESFATPNPAYGQRLRSLFAFTPRHIVGAAGRLSPEKGFGELVQAAADVVKGHPETGFVLFGDGPLRTALSQAIACLGLTRNFILAGFHGDVGSFLPHLDMGVLSSFTEGLPVILLELCAAGVPVVATTVGGIPEVIDHEQTGILVPPGDASALSRGILDLLSSDDRRRDMAQAARAKVREQYTFTLQSLEYQKLFDEILTPREGQKLVLTAES